MVYYKMLEIFMIVLFSFQMRRRRRGKQIFFYSGLVRASQNFRKKRTDKAETPRLEHVPGLRLKASPQATIPQTSVRDRLWKGCCASCHQTVCLVPSIFLGESCRLQRRGFLRCCSWTPPFSCPSPWGSSASLQAPH